MAQWAPGRRQSRSASSPHAPSSPKAMSRAGEGRPRPARVGGRPRSPARVSSRRSGGAVTSRSRGCSSPGSGAPSRCASEREIAKPIARPRCVPLRSRPFRTGAPSVPSRRIAGASGVGTRADRNSPRRCTERSRSRGVGKTSALSFRMVPSTATDARFPVGLADRTESHLSACPTSHLLGGSFPIGNSSLAPLRRPVTCGAGAWGHGDLTGL